MPCGKDGQFTVARDGHTETLHIDRTDLPDARVHSDVEFGTREERTYVRCLAPEDGQGSGCSRQVRKARPIPGIRPKAYKGPNCRTWYAFLDPVHALRMQNAMRVLVWRFGTGSANRHLATPGRGSTTLRGRSLCERTMGQARLNTLSWATSSAAAAPKTRSAPTEWHSGGSRVASRWRLPSTTKSEDPRSVPWTSASTRPRCK